MMQMMRWIANNILRFRRKEDGSATVEFVIILPFFMVMFVSVFESGLIMTKQMMLERALDITVRAIRLSPQNANITHDTVRQMICDNALIFNDCVNSLQVELAPVSSMTWVMPPREADCIDRDSELDPVLSFNPGLQSDVMFVRACMVVDPMYPNMGLGFILTKDPSGGVRLISSSAFAIEPI